MTKWNMIIIISKKTLHCKLLFLEIQNVFYPISAKYWKNIQSALKIFAQMGLKRIFDMLK